MGDLFREMAPTVLNAANASTGDGATFVHDEALGTERLLHPGDTSGAIALRFGVNDPQVIPNMHLALHDAAIVS